MLLRLFLFISAASITLQAGVGSEPSSPRILHVSPEGNDGWSGLLPSPNPSGTDGPLLTPTRARDLLRERPNGAGGAKVLLSGVHFIPEGLTLEPRDGGVEEQPVVWGGTPDAPATLIGGIRITEWEPFRDGIWRAALPADASASLQIFENGKRLTLARIPEEGYLRLEKPVEGQERSAFVYRQDDLDLAPGDLAHARVFLWPEHDWFSAELPVKRLDPKSRTIELEGRTGYAITPGNRYVIRNTLAGLTGPGQVFIDLSERTVYVRPAREPIADQEIVIATAPHVIHLRGEPDAPVRHVRFENLNLAIADGDAVQLSSVEDVTVTGCLIENGGLSGVGILGASRGVRVVGNRIREHGQHGLLLQGGGPPGPYHNRDHLIENNHIHHCGRLVGHGYGIEIDQSGENIVAHNLIHDMPRYGVSLKGLRFQPLREQLPEVTFETRHDYLHSRQNRIAFNHIHRVNQDSQDTGAIEAWGSGRDNIIDHNLIHDTGNEEFDLQSGIYLDDAADYFTVTNNIVYNVVGTHGNQPIYAKGIGNRITNNILIAGPTNESGIRSMTLMDERADGHIYTRNIIVFEPITQDRIGQFGMGIDSLHDPGRVLTWRFEAPADDEYDVWFLYAADNTGPATDMPERTTLQVDEREPISIARIPNTGGWGHYRWERVASLPLEKGSRVLRWTNVEGGGLNWDAILLTTRRDIALEGLQPPNPVADEHRVVLQAEAHEEGVGQLQQRAFYRFDNWSDDRIEVSDENIFWDAAVPPVALGSPAEPDWESWRSLLGGRFDRRSLIADPGFVNLQERDFRLHPDSPALQVGFQPIDVGSIGLREDFPARLKSLDH